MPVRTGRMPAPRFPHASRGQVTIFVVLFLLVVSLGVGFSLAFVALREVAVAERVVASKSVYALSEAGVEDLVFRVKTSKQYDAVEAVLLGSASADVTVTSAGNEVEVVSVGRLKGNVRATKSVLVINATNVQFFYGVQVGEGGLTMGQSSTIQGASGTPGNIYSNGPVTGDNAATITGDVTVAGGLTEDAQARSTVCNTDQIFGQSNPVVDLAQSFQPSETKPLGRVRLYLKKFGTPGDRTIRIAADAGGSPATTSLANGTLQSALVGANYAWIDVSFASPPTLTAGNTYWIVFDAATNASKYWSWCSDSNQGFGNGVGKYSPDWDDDPWTQIIGDLAFKTYFGSGVNALDSVVVLGDARANTITASKVCGDAYYQTIDAGSLSFVNSPAANTCPEPLTPGTALSAQPDPPLGNLPISQANLDQWKLDSDPDSSPHIGNLTVSSDTSFGPEKITGNLVMTSNNKTLTVTGTIYVQGYIDIANGSRIRCAASYGTASCIVMTDQWAHIANNGVFEGSGQAGSYVMILSTSSCDGSGSGGPCTHHSAAMDLHNNATGAIFYATNGLVHLHNGVNATEVTAYKLALENNAVVTYEQGLANANFTAGPSGGRGISQWREVP